MLKILIGLLSGTVVTAFLFVGPLSPIPATGESDNSSLTDTQTPDAATYREAIVTLFQQAASEISDSDMFGYYQQLLAEYELDKASSWIAPAEDSSPEEIIPDIAKINQSALILPLVAAGKNIKDEEIARFYYKLLKDAGWLIESN